MRRRAMLAGFATIGLASCAGPASLPAGGARYVVFFQEWSAQLDDSAAAAVKQAAENARTHPTAPVLVSGYADPEGSPQANKDLSRTRAQVVADALVAGGVAKERIKTNAVGSVGVVMDNQEARRVVITLGA